MTPDIQPHDTSPAPKNLNLWTTHHPDLEEVWVFSAEQKAINFINLNVNTWYKNGIDSHLFTFRESPVKDTLLMNSLFDVMPELFL